MNWTSISNTVAKEISSMGFVVKIIHASGGTSITKGIWSQSNQNDVDNKAVSMLTQNEKILYIPSIKKEPIVGDILLANGVEYGINIVDKYCPTNITLAYKITVIN